MGHDAEIERLIKVIAHAAKVSGLYKLPLILCAAARMREAVREPGLAKRAEESLLEMMLEAPESAKRLLRSMAWIARSVRIRSTTLAELAIPRLCAESVKRAELDWQLRVLSETSKAAAA